MEPLAFCKALWAHNGGRFNANGLPITGRKRSKDDNIYVRGECTYGAYDCGQCEILSRWLEQLIAQGWYVSWECDGCLRATENEERGKRWVQGFYQAGRKVGGSSLSSDYDPDRPTLQGCTRCGWESSFLQLVLRR